MRSSRRLLFVAAAAIVPRLIFALLTLRIEGVSGFFSVDSGGYIETAKSLLFGSFSTNGAPELLRTPGYPLLLTPAVFFGHVVIIGMAANLVMSSVSGCFVWLIASDLAPGSKAALWATALYCVEPVGFLMSEKLYSETLFTAQLFAFVWILLRFLKQPSWGKLATAAVLLGLCVYTRPIAIYLGPLLSILLLFSRQSLCLPAGAS